MSMNVQLEVYEGPLDLLLHLIKKNEVTITDIPIALITEQYLETLEAMQSLNLDMAGEYIVMASTLIHIKSRLLLPLEEGDEEEEEGTDPRDELVRRLLEYQRYKDASEDLAKREILNRDVFVRASEAVQEVKSKEFAPVSLFDLITALRRVLEKLPEETVHTVVLENFSVRGKMTMILEVLNRSASVSFESLFETAASRMEVVVTLLAVLELMKIRAAIVKQEERLGPIMIEGVGSLGEVKDRLNQEGNEEVEGHGS